MLKIIIAGVTAILSLIVFASILSAAAAALDAGRSVSSPMYPKAHGGASNGTVCGPKILHGWPEANVRQPKILQICP